MVKTYAHTGMGPLDRIKAAAVLGRSKTQIQMQARSNAAP
jgi:hypothetical protein